MRLQDDKLDSPLVAVFNSWINIVHGHVHLHKAAEAVEVGVRIAGGTPL